MNVLKKALSMVLEFLLLFGFVYLSSSCALIQLSEDTNRRAVSGWIHGSVKNTQQGTAPLIIAACDKNGGIVKFQRLAPNTCYYAFTLPAGKVYDILAFEDLNGNLKYDKNEPAGSWMNREGEILHSKTEILTDLTLSIKSELPVSHSLDINNLDPSQGSNFVVVTGAIANLDDESFSSASAKKGLWSPLAFMDEFGVGVYFLEKYDPDKIPVLFINGIGGSPRDWKPFFKRMDRNKYQPWFFFYPSGARIESTAIALHTIVKRMRTEFKFDSTYVVAHSMGGLIAREFIKESLDSGDEYIKLFISISTPWVGDEDAEWSIGAPLVIPCWRDLRPSSDFIQNSSSKDIGSHIPYYLIFSYRGDRKPFRLNNDNVVYLSSELGFDMQKRAKKVYGFNLSHSTILTDFTVIDTCLSILAEHDPE